MPNTILTLSTAGVPPYSARGLSQTLNPIEAASAARRSINGVLTDTADPLFQKFESTITGSDVDPPAMDLVWPGRILTVDCIVELSQEDATDLTLGRTAVPGSTRMADGFVFYRPRLTMMVMGWSADADEWEHITRWALNLEEV